VLVVVNLMGVNRRKLSVERLLVWPEPVSGMECMSVKKIYVGNLPWSATDSELRDLFSTIGTVHSAAVVSDRETGRSRGFGFIEMDEGDAEKAISELNGRDMGGRALRVNEAQERQRRGGGGGGGGGGGRDRW
jgi:RNA recognition motif-containing protein